VRQSLGAGPVLLKVARWDPDKRWLLTLETLAQLKRTYQQPKLVARGGAEAHGVEVLAHARALGLRVQHVALDDSDPEGLAAAFGTAESADVVNVTTSLRSDGLRILYSVADGVLANSGREPFGLVGLEAMASGGTVYTSNTGEEYARHMDNAIVLNSADPEEAAWYITYLDSYPGERERLRAAARETAQQFVWDRVVDQLLTRVQVVFTRQLTNSTERETLEHSVLSSSA
jgi:glycosyltransferase involved in cell wall biosynthesis